MDKTEYLGYRKVNTYPPILLYHYYVETKPEAFKSLTWEEFHPLFVQYCQTKAVDSFISFLKKAIEYFDSKFHIAILFDHTGTKILKIY